MHHDMSSWHLFQHPLVPMAVFKHRFPAQVLSHCPGILVFHRFKDFFKPALEVLFCNIVPDDLGQTCFLAFYQIYFA